MGKLWYWDLKPNMRAGKKLKIEPIGLRTPCPKLI